jgi:alpha-amylase
LIEKLLSRLNIYKMKNSFIQPKITGIIIFLVLNLFSQNINSQVNNTRRQIVLQGFWWDYWNSNYPNGWSNYLVEIAPRLKSLGIDAVWIPPTIKNTGTNSVGYAPFDHYDLGDKYQKGNVKTRMGDKDELLRMVAVLKANGIDVIQDIVLNHVTGAGSGLGLGGQDVTAMDDGSTNKYKNFRYSCFDTPGTNESAASYLNRSGRFPKNWTNFYPNANNPCCTNPINSPYWGPDISYEANAFGASGNATYNPTQTSNYMRDNMRNWMIWYKKQVGWDGVRLDAVKHFPTYVAEDFLWNIQFGSLWANGGEDMFAVGEWVGGTNELDAWVSNVQSRAGTFDFGLRNAITGIVSGNGAFDLGTVTSYQQQNRYKTVPFVNNHDTFRPEKDANGNYIGWDSGNELAPHVEPNDGRKSVVHAIILAVDGAPQIFFEDLFNIGYLSNRFSHSPSDVAQLPIYSDMENLLWCHQNLHFKEGNYSVRWQAADALVIEREGKALVAVNDQWSTWQNLVGVQTAWSDGTTLTDYSGANGTNTITVYGGGKADIAIPPCDGSALLGRRGYSIWAPAGITTNYNQPNKRITQEWEMAGDLGDRHTLSLKQGGALPDNSTQCRVVGKIFVKAGEKVKLELYPENANNSITVLYADKDCAEFDSISAAGTIIDSIVPTYSGWMTVKIKNTTATQTGQKCYVKLNYLAPEVVDPSVVKNNCACAFSFANLEESEISATNIYPNPTNDVLNITFEKIISENLKINFIGMDGRILDHFELNGGNDAYQLSTERLKAGVYFIELTQGNQIIRKQFVKL